MKNLFSSDTLVLGLVVGAFLAVEFVSWSVVWAIW